MTSSKAEMNGVVIFYFLSWSILWKRQLRMDYAYDLDNSLLYFTNAFINLAASSRSLYWWLCSSYEISETIKFLKYGKMCWGFIFVSLPKILIVFIFIWLFESRIQLNSIKRFSYLAMNGSRSEFNFISI